MAYLLNNNVLTTLHTSITSGSTSIIIDAATTPNQNPPAPTAGNIATLTLVDNVVSPTKIEIVTYTTMTNNGDGTYTLTGVTRGTEGTTAQAFASLAVCFEAITAGTVAALSAIGTNTLLQFCGDGSDGSATITTPTVMFTDMYYTNLTISGSGTLNTNGYTLYVSGVLDLTAAAAGAIFAPSGANAVGTAAGSGGTTSGVSGVSVPTGFSGGAGGSGGAVGNAGPTSSALIGGYGGNGGSSSIASGGFSGGFTNVTNFNDVRRPGGGLVFFNGTSVSPIGGGNGGAGGGGGTPALTTGGGGGGGGCGLVLYAGTIATSVSTPAAVIKGGNGGNGGNGGVNGGGCGGGGGGGPVIVGYGVRVGPTITNGIRTQGGTAGSGGTGTSGPLNAGGGSGVIHVYNLLTGTGITSGRVAGVSGNNGAGGVSSANL